MWFTRVSIANPVMAVMVMLAFVVLGGFALQRMKVDQFPNIDFPTVVVTVGYPGASAEIVENEVTTKVEEAVNTIAGISQLYSRSYESTSVVIIQFNLDMDGRKAADDVREKISQVQSAFPDEVDEPRVQRFDPASRPVWTVALTSPDGSKTPAELTQFGDQVLKKRLENVRGVGSVSLVGSLKREINIYLKPTALEAFGVSADQVMNAVRSENRDLPAGALRARDSERIVQVDGRFIAPAEMALLSRPWSQPEVSVSFRETYLELLPILHFAYSAINPVAIKSLMKAVGLPAGELRKPLTGLQGEALGKGLRAVRELGLDRKYGWHSAALAAA